MLIMLLVVLLLLLMFLPFLLLMLFVLVLMLLVWFFLPTSYKFCKFLMQFAFTCSVLTRVFANLHMKLVS